VIQRVTAAFLVVVLAFHFFLLHFVHHAADVTFGMTSARMQELTYFSLMVLFLVTATFHGVNGVYNALINQGLAGIQKRVVQGVLIIASALLISDLP
jgi:succinate dehydrogenase / fumarate reductase membrane anchor subunit